MENIVLTIGGLLKKISLSDVFFFGASLLLILLLIYIAYLIKSDEADISESGNQNLPKIHDNIATIANNIEKNYEPKHVDLSKYEQEMEDTAIISYDELLKRASSDIAYDENYKTDNKDVIVKKVDDTNLSKTREYVNLPEAVMMNYENEEAFLDALKTIKNNLVR